MRPLSMTAFGRGEYNDGSQSWAVEVRSVNHRYCDISIKIPREYAGLEERIRKVVQTFYSRGKIDLFVALKAVDAAMTQVVPNLAYARQYYASLSAISRELGLPQTPDLTLLAMNRDIVVHEAVGIDLETAWSSVQRALHEAMEAGLAMRSREGLALKGELAERLILFASKVEVIAAAIPALMAVKEKGMRDRLALLCQEIAVDPARLAQEVAILAEKGDVTEELVRLRSHINQFAAYLDLDEAVGRRLDFLLQEFFREINTIGSKISDAAIAHQTVEMKNEVEKLREQVQNLE